MPRLGLGFWMVLGLAAFWAWAFLEPAHLQTPKIQTSQETKGAIHAQEERQSDERSADSDTTVSPPKASGVENWKSKDVAENAGHEGAESSTGVEYWPDFLGLHLKITDSLLAIFTGGLLWATLLLWWVTRTLANDARQSSERQLRAYIQVVEASVTRLKANETVTTVIQIKNTGQTPAGAVSMSVDIKVRPWPIDLTGELDSVEPAEVAVSLGSGSTFSVTSTSDSPITNAEFNGIQTGDQVILTYGVVQYEDVFKVSRQTKIAAWFARDPKHPERGYSMHPLKRWNETT